VTFVALVALVIFVTIVRCGLAFCGVRGAVQRGGNHETGSEEENVFEDVLAFQCRGMVRAAEQPMGKQQDRREYSHDPE
jgi:hypothetical protein